MEIPGITPLPGMIGPRRVGAKPDRQQHDDSFHGFLEENEDDEQAQERATPRRLQRPPSTIRKNSQDAGGHVDVYA